MLFLSPLTTSPIIDGAYVESEAHVDAEPSLPTGAGSAAAVGAVPVVGLVGCRYGSSVCLRGPDLRIQWLRKRLAFLGGEIISPRRLGL